MKLNDLVNSQVALKEISGVKMKATKAFELRTFYKTVETELNAFEETRNQKIKEYGTEGEGGSWAIAPDSENMPKFIEELNELLGKDIAIDIPNLSAEDLKDADLSVAQIAQLEWLIK